MKIETKYNIGDEVYSIWQNQIQHTKISEIIITVNSDNKIEVKYNIYVRTKAGSSLYGRTETQSENLIYKTKEELRDFLFPLEEDTNE